MKSAVVVLLAFINFTSLFSQPDVNTSGDNSPAVVILFTIVNFAILYYLAASAIGAGEDILEV